MLGGSVIEEGVIGVGKVCVGWGGKRDRIVGG